MEANTDPFEDMLSIADIRAHCKANDVPKVTDSQLAIYRRAGFEQAQKYTGKAIFPVKKIVETIDVGAPLIRFENGYSHKLLCVSLQRPAIDGYVSIIGPHGTQNHIIQPNTRDIEIKINSNAFEWENTNCCDSCDPVSVSGYTAYYNAGIRCGEQVDATILTGILKFIAWNVENPGDEILSVRNSTSTQTGGINGTNNAGWASGAIELWETCQDICV